MPSGSIGCAPIVARISRKNMPILFFKFVRDSQESPYSPELFLYILSSLRWVSFQTSKGMFHLAKRRCSSCHICNAYIHFSWFIKYKICTGCRSDCIVVDRLNLVHHPTPCFTPWLDGSCPSFLLFCADKIFVPLYSDTSLF